MQARLDKPEWGPKLPEALIPLGNGETILSRLVRQFREAGVTEIYIGVGVSGKTSSRYCNWLESGGYKKGKCAFEVDRDAEVWTKERLGYVDSLGCTSVPVEKFENTGAAYTVGKLLKHIVGLGNEFDVAQVVMGDYVMTDNVFRNLLSLPVPCMWCPKPHHQGWLVDYSSADFLWRWLLRPRDLEWRSYHFWDCLSELEGFHIEELVRSSDLIEVESVASYEKARGMVR